MFFFFFDELYDIPEVQESFFTVIGSRLLNYGYFDMNEYIKITKNKDQLREELKGIHSKYELLYKGSYPAKEKAYEFRNCEKLELHHEKTSTETMHEFDNPRTDVYKIVKIVMEGNR